MISKNGNDLARAVDRAGGSSFPRALKPLRRKKKKGSVGGVDQIEKAIHGKEGSVRIRLHKGDF